MGTNLQSGYLVIADLSGYTSYMAGTELEHSPEIIRELLTMILDNVTPHFSLVEIEGDAVFVYAPEGRIQRGETLLELIENTYAAFRNHVSSMMRATSCRCRACQEIPQLDMKFVAHFGPYSAQSIAGRTKLVGSSINVIHRLLKNNVEKETGWSVYALFTDQAWKRLGVTSADMHVSSEEYDHLGTIATHSFDLGRRYQEMMSLRRIVVEEGEADFGIEGDFPIPPVLLWDWFNDPIRRDRWMGESTTRADITTGERPSIGGVIACSYGGGESVERILDWRPFQYMTCEGRSGRWRYRMTTSITPKAGGGSHGEIRCRLITSLPAIIVRPIARSLFRSRFDLPARWDRLTRAIAEEHKNFGHQGLPGYIPLPVG